jgi:hypothetical protein
MSSGKTTTKRASTAESRLVTSNPRLEFAKSINGLSQKMEAFVKAAENLGTLKDTLVDLDLQIQSKTEELNRLTEDNEHTKKRLQTETTLYLSEFRYDGAKEILGKRNEVPISTSELEQMKTNLQKLTIDREKEISEIVKKEKQRAEKSIAAATSMQDLRQKALTAELTATTHQQVKEIDNLNQTIDSLKQEIAAQRKLTEAVANAGRQGPITLRTDGK